MIRASQQLRILNTNTKTEAPFLFFSFLSLSTKVLKVMVSRGTSTKIQSTYIYLISLCITGMIGE